MSLAFCPSRVRLLLRLRVPEMFGDVLPHIPPADSLPPDCAVPGRILRIFIRSRPRTITSESCADVSTAAVSALSEWTLRVSAVIVTDSLVAPTAISMLPRETRSFAVNVTAARSYLRKPVDSSVTLYRPGVRPTITKLPVSFVDPVLGTPVASLVIVICAFATTAPDGSTTVPLIVPVTVWAADGAAKSRHRNAARQFLKKDLDWVIVLSSECRSRSAID